MADTKKEYTSNLHPKGDMDTTVYPNVKSENIIDKDTTAYTTGKVPDSSLVQKSLDGISENLETTKIQVATNKNNIETLQGNYTGLQYQVNTNSSNIALTKTQVETNKANIAKNTQDIAANLDAKQATLYRHTIEITKDNEASLILTTESTISTEINTMDKFISAFTGSELACMCALNDTNAWNIHYIGIQVGTTLNDTSMMSTQDLDTGMTFTDVFGTSGFTITDNVTTM